MGETAEKLHHSATAHDAYARYLELAPTAKDAEAVKKRMEQNSGLHLIREFAPGPWVHLIATFPDCDTVATNGPWCKCRIL